MGEWMDGWASGWMSEMDEWMDKQCLCLHANGNVLSRPCVRIFCSIRDLGTCLQNLRVLWMSR